MNDLIEKIRVETMKKYISWKTVLAKSRSGYILNASYLYRSAQSVDKNIIKI
jgi:hypothetical protein